MEVKNNLGLVFAFITNKGKNPNYFDIVDIFF